MTEEGGKNTNSSFKDRVLGLVYEPNEIELLKENKSLLESTPYEELAPEIDEHLIDHDWNQKDAFLGNNDVSALPDILSESQGKRFKRLIEKKKFGKAISFLQSHTGIIGQRKLNAALKPQEPQPNTPDTQSFITPNSLRTNTD